MALATYKDLCIDVVDERRMAEFYAAALGLRGDPEDGLLGPTPRHTVWLNPVPEPKTVKNRVHVDLHTGDVADLVAAGARVVNDSDFRWTVLADPEGQEFCAFVREQPPPQRLYEICVDAADPAAITRWWAEVFGVEAGGPDDHGVWWLEDLPEVPFQGFCFVRVPEPKTAKNRVHWDVYGQAETLLGAGARTIRSRGEDRPWDVLADPEGNEFCVFAPRPD